MELDRETIYQLGLAGGSVTAFIAGAYVVVTTYRTNGNITAEGGMVLVGTIAVFVLLMLGAGLLLERLEFSD
jgi:hypothetical protein